MQSTSAVFIKAISWASVSGWDDGLDSVGVSGRWKSITGNAFADDGADPSKRNAAHVPSNPLKGELIEKVKVEVLNHP